MFTIIENNQTNPLFTSWSFLTAPQLCTAVSPPSVTAEFARLARLAVVDRVVIPRPSSLNRGKNLPTFNRFSILEEDYSEQSESDIERSRSDVDRMVYYTSHSTLRHVKAARLAVVFETPSPKRPKLFAWRKPRKMVVQGREFKFQFPNLEEGKEGIYDWCHKFCATTVLDQMYAQSLIGKYVALDPRTDHLVNLLESTVIFYYHMFTAKTFTARMMAIAAFAKMMQTKLNNTQVAMMTLISVWEHLSKTSPDEECEFQLQAFEFPDISDLRTFLNYYETFKSSKLYEKLYKFSMYALSLSLFDKVGINMDKCNMDKVAQEAIKKKYHFGLDFVHSLLDTVLFLCERGYQCLQSGSIEPIFHSELKYQEWFDTADKLIRNSKLLYTDTAGLQIDKFAYLADLKDTIEKGKSMRRLAARPEDKILFNKILSSLEMAHDMECTKRNAMKDRPAPFPLLLYGGSSVGKSTLINVLFQQFGKLLNLSTQPEFKFTKNPNETFWSGHNPSQWCIVLDDIGFLNPTLGVLDPTIGEMLSINNYVSYVTNQAELQDKGRCPVRAKFLIATTNTPHLNAHAYFSCPLAVQRRLPWIIDVRPKYCDPDKPGMLSSTLCPPTEPGTYPDYWIFVVRKVVPANPSLDARIGARANIVDHATYNTMREFLTWFNQAVLDHEASQKKIAECGNNMAQVTLCSTCNIPSGWCTCMETQALEIEAPEPEESENEVVSISRTAMLKEYIQGTDAYEKIVLGYYGGLFGITSYSLPGLCADLSWGRGWKVKTLWESKHRLTLTRKAIGALGQVAYSSFSPTPWLSQAAVAVVAIIAAYKASSVIREHFFGPTPQGGVPSKSYLAQKREDKFGVYEHPYVERMQMNVDDISPQTASNKGVDPSHTIKMIENAIYVFTSLCEGVTRVTNAVNVKGNVYMCNTHGIAPKTPFYLTVTSTSGSGIVGNSNKILVSDTMVYRIPKSDFTFIQLRCRPPGRDLIPYFNRASYDGLLKGMYIGRDINGTVWHKEVANVRQGIDTFVSHGQKVTHPTWSGKVENPTDVGDCGAVLFSNTPAGHIILGIHTLGRDCDIRAIKISYEVLKEACEVFEQDPVESGYVQVSAPSKERWISHMTPQSVVAGGNPGTANVVGSYVGEFKMRKQSCVAPTLIQATAVYHGYSVTHGAPDMSDTPWLLALNDMTRPVTLLDEDILEHCVKSIIDGTKNVSVKDVEVYDLKTAVNGRAGLKYCDKLNRKTSAGCPYKCPKTRFLYEVPSGPAEDLVMPTEEICNTMTEIENTYAARKRWHPVFSGNLKDEPVTLEKVAAKKTRVFTASPMAWTLVVRKHLLSVIVHMQTNRFVYETGPGVVAQSLEWEQIREYLVQHGENRIVAGDYSKFDKRMPANVILAAFDVIISICQRAGYSDREMAIVRGIAYDTAFPMVDFNGTLIEFYGSNPSGHPLTVIINGLANSIYMRYCYANLARQFVAKLYPGYVPTSHATVLANFKKNVNLLTYGDDNIMGVSKSCDWFNHTAIAEVLALVDIGYTMADKEAKSVPFIHIDDSNFLKRTWRWDVDVEAYVAPLDHASINKMLTTCLLKGNITPEQHAIAVIETAGREYFWYGKEVFHEKRQMFLDIVRTCNLEAYVEDSTFPTWESLKEDFYENSHHVFLKREVKSLKCY